MKTRHSKKKRFENQPTFLFCCYSSRAEKRRYGFTTPPLYNASVFVKEGLGYQLTFAGLVNTAPGSGLVFRPLTPRLETKLFLIWNKYQTFTPIAERFLDGVKMSFGEHSTKQTE